MGSPLYSSTLRANTIRLLTILPGPADSPLECKLSTISLDCPDIYHALSYVWGSPNPSSTLSCDNHVIPITSNLSSALHEYRLRNTCTPIWVDALCINQSNTSERTAQVRMMQRIYSLASRVIIWLGPSHPTDALAVETLRAIHKPWATYQGIPLFTWNEGENATTHDGRLARFLPDACYIALATFLMRPWFTRIWIVQELLVAKEVEVWCGSETLDAETVLDGAAKMILLNNVNTRTQLCASEVSGLGGGVERLKLSCAGRLQALRQAKAQGWCSMIYLLLLTRSFEATDKRDKIFALVGLANDADPSFVDYELSYEEVVTKVSKTMLEGRIGPNGASVLDIWSCIERKGEEEVPRRSWAVDWTRLGNSLHTTLMNDYASESPLITRQSELEFSTDEQGNENLYVRGTLVDLIEHILPSPPCILHLVPWSDLLLPSTSFALRDWHLSAISLASQLATTSPPAQSIYAPTGEALYEAFWRTLCCNRHGVGTSARPSDDTAYQAWRDLQEAQGELFMREKEFENATRRDKGWFYAISTMLVAFVTYRLRTRPTLRWIAPSCLPAAIWSFRAVWSARLTLIVQRLRARYAKEMMDYTMRQSSFEASFSQWSQGRQLCLTRKGYLGWAPVAARVGDAVGLFAGCRIPYVLAWYGGEEYRVVGDMYLHGAMDGQGEGLEGTMLKIT